MKLDIVPIAVVSVATLAAEKLAHHPRVRLLERAQNLMHGRGFVPDSQTDLSVLAQVRDASQKSLDDARMKAPEKKS
jgi:hypothetical protein